VPRVLVVEDEEALAAALQSGLEAEGFSVEIATDGITGLAYARSGDFDVVVLDLMLPGMNGVRLCQRLRETDPTVPVLVLTAKQGEWDESETLDVGADDYLRKPFSFAVLVSRLRALLRRAGAADGELIGIGGLTLNVSERRCWRDGVEIALTPREFALLETLTRSAGRTVANRQLVAKVCDEDNCETHFRENSSPLFAFLFWRMKISP